MREVDEYVYIHYNFVYTPKYFSPTNLPYEIKHLINNKMHSMEKNKQEMIKNFLNVESDSQEFNNFIDKTKRLDKIRNENFESVFPELHYYLKAYNYI